MAKKESSKKGTVNPETKLRNELKKMLKDINEEGLLFLTRQAQTILYNQEVDRINEKKEKESNKKKPAGPTVRTKTGTTLEIIPGDKNQNFTIRLDTTIKFFSLEDFRGLVKISHTDVKPTEKSARLYRFLLKERQDFLMDNNIRTPGDTRLTDLIALIQKNYKTKK